MAFPVVAVLGAVTAGLGLFNTFKEKDNQEAAFNNQISLLSAQLDAKKKAYLIDNGNKILQEAKEQYLESLALLVLPVFVKNVFHYLFLFVLVYLFIMPVFNKNETDGENFAVR